MNLVLAVRGALTVLSLSGLSGLSVPSVLSVLSILSVLAVQPGVVSAETILDEAAGESASCLRSAEVGIAPMDSLVFDGFLDTAHFRIHYARSGPLRIPTWPDSSIIDSLGSYFEHAWRRFHVEMGMRVPPADGSYGGGEDLVDCFVTDLGSASGTVHRIEPAATPECSNAFASLILLDKYSIVTSARPLTAHEYFHVLQDGYGGNETWFDESTAVWAEREVWPDNMGLFNTTACWFHTPYFPFRAITTQCRLYGTVHFWLFMEQKTDSTFVPQVLRRSCEDHGMDPVRNEVTARGGDFDTWYAEFALWNNATGSRDDGRHYRNGRILPEISVQAEHRSLPVTEDSLPPLLLAREGGSNYIRFDGPGRRDTLCLRFDGDPSMRALRRVSVAATRPSVVQTEATMAPDENGDCVFRIPDWPSCLDVTLIVTNLFDLPRNVREEFTYSAWESGTDPGPTILATVPNPTLSGTTLSFWTGEAGLLRFSVHDAQGRQVRSPGSVWMEGGEHDVYWDGNDETGRSVPAGIYFLRLETNGWSGGRKVFVVR